MLGRKIGMSQTFSPEGELIPVTLIQATKNVVTLRRSENKDGYVAVQLALPKKKVNIDEEKDTQNNPDLFSAKMEFAGEMGAEIADVTVEQFIPGDVVEVIGISKGKGFQGVVRRHHFKGGPASHGHTDWERKAGSIGSRFPQHVRKGKRMAGRMGADRVTVKNLKVVLVDKDRQVIAIKGAVPGRKGGIVAVQLL